MKIGYVWKQNILQVDIFAKWQLLEQSQIDDLTQYSVNLAREAIDSVSSEMARRSSGFGTQTDKVYISVDSSREIAWERFIATVEPGSKVLIEEFDEISLYPEKQLEFIEAAKGRNILILPMDQKELIDLSIEAAYAMLTRYSLSAMAKKQKPRSEEASYEKMLTLMKQGMSVVEIIGVTGWSRSTLFRLRREYKDRLTTDLPSFKSRYQ